jgi:pimeloyl-ACP methyl ester carboxylesterase
MVKADDFFIDGPEGRLSVRTKGLESDPKAVVLMVQGSNLSGQTGYDFQYGPDNSYSVMDAVVARGIGAITFSLRGYGLSDAPAQPLAVRTEEAIEDLAAIMAWLAERGRPVVDLLGWSWGGRINGHYASRNPERVRRMVFMGPALGGGALIMPGPTKDEAWWSNTRPDYEQRLDPTLMDAPARNAFIDLMLEYDPRAPNGIRAENAVGSKRVDATQIQCPVLMIYGSEGGKQSYMQGNISRTEFFEALPTKEKALFVLPDGGDYGHLQHPRRKYHSAIAEFLI